MGLFRNLSLLVAVLSYTGGEQANLDQVGQLVAEMVKKYFPTCLPVLLSTAPNSPVFSALLRALNARAVVLAVIDGSAEAPYILENLMEDDDITCHAVILQTSTTTSAIINVTTNNYSNMYNDSSSNLRRSNTLITTTITNCSTSSVKTDTERNRSSITGSCKISLALRLLERAGLWKLPQVPVFVVGRSVEVEAILLHPSLRNTIHCLYLALHHPTAHYPEVVHRLPMMTESTEIQETLLERVSVYRRCLFCDAGEAGVRLVRHMNLSDPSFHLSQTLIDSVLEPDEFGNFYGHQLKIVSVSYFPFVDYSNDIYQPGTIVTLKDSIDARLINTFARKINFTYIIHEEPHRAFGLPNNGKFDGMMGQLQREDSDFCTISGPSSDRLKVMDFLRGYPSDPLTIISLKPSFLPRHLAFVRPFSAEVWLTTASGVILWGVTLWTLHRLGRHEKRHNFQFSTTLFYGWGALLDQPPSDPSTSVSEQILVGWWLVFCLIISTAFRSALISHLTVQGTLSPIETLEDLTKAHNWRWGTEPWLMKGVPRNYFSKHTDPVVKKIYAHMEVFDADAGLKEVQKNGFSLIDFEKYISIIIESRYTDAQGRTPFYVSKRGFRHVIAFGWCFRKGAPYFFRFNDMMLRLEAAGVITYWTKNVVAERVRLNRMKENPDPDTRYDLDTSMKGLSEVVLGLDHLQGAFYLLFLGFGLALFALMTEKWMHVRASSHT